MAAQSAPAAPIEFNGVRRQWDGLPVLAGRPRRRRLQRLPGRAGGEAATPVRTGLTAPAYTDGGLTNGTTYYYQVTATGAGGEGARSAEVSGTPAANLPVYRLYSPYDGDHFYTASPAEEQAAAASGFYTYEGVIGYAPPAAASGTTPLYRLYFPPTGEHFYTPSAAEQALALPTATPPRGRRSKC